MMGREILDVLRQNPLCRRLPAPQLEGIAAASRFRRCAEGCLLRGLPGTNTTVFLVGTGEVHRYLLAPDGQEFALRPCLAGDLLGLDDRYSEMTARAAEEDTAVWLIPGDRFVDALCGSPEGAAEALRLLWDEVLRQRRMLTEVAFRDVGERLAHKLAELAGSDPKGRVFVPRAELAHLIGASPEEVIRQLHHLREVGLIRYEPHHREICVPDMGRLRIYRQRRADLS